MPRPTLPSLLLLLALAATARSACQVMEVVQTWDLGYSMNIALLFTADVQAWNATLQFDTPLANLETWSDRLDTADNQTYTVSNNQWDGPHQAGQTITLFFVVDFRSELEPAQLVSVRFLGEELC